MYDYLLDPETTTTSANVNEVPLYVTDEEYNVSLYFDGVNIDGTVTGGNTSEVIQALNDVKQLQTETNNILTNLSVIFLLFVALFGILIAQGFIKIFKR